MADFRFLSDIHIILNYYNIKGIIHRIDENIIFKVD